MVTNYDAIAERYNQDRVHFHQTIDQDLALVISKNPHAKILDVGCGTGLWLANQKTFFDQAHFFGVEPSAAMREQATIPGVIEGTAEQIPADDESFDFISTQFTLHHFSDKPKALSEMMRVLKPGGTLMIKNICPERSDSWWIYQYFPMCRTYDQSRFWSVETSEKYLTADSSSVNLDFSIQNTLSFQQVYNEAKRRITSQLTDIADEEYAKGFDLLSKAAVDKIFIAPTIAKILVRK